MKKYIAESIGTFALVLIGCAAITIGNLGPALGTAGQPLSALAILPIGLAFGLAVTAMAYGIGPISGCHINPAVTLGVWAAGRMPTSDVPGYIAAQFAGATAGAAVLMVILTGRTAGYDVAAAGLGQTTLGAYTPFAGLLVEFVATFLFLVVILGATSKAGATPVAGLAIGLTLMILHLAFVPATGTSLNPARSFGPAIFVGGKAMADLWIYMVAPPLAGLAAGFLFKSKTLEA